MLITYRSFSLNGINVITISISKAHQTIDDVLVWKWSSSAFDEKDKALQFYPSLVEVH